MHAYLALNFKPNYCSNHHLDDPSIYALICLSKANQKIQPARSTRIVKDQFQSRQSHGFTLIETLMVVSITAILLAITIPSMRSMIERAAVNSAINAFSTAINLTRVEAIKRGISVVMCPSNDADKSEQPSCLDKGHDWSGGWIIFTDRLNKNKFSSTNSVLIQAQGDLNGSGPITQDPALILIFRPSGLMSTGASEISFDSPSLSLDQKRRLCLGPSGRPQLINDPTKTCTWNTFNRNKAHHS